MEMARFLAVAVAGLMLDLAVAWGAVELLGLPLWLAAAFGFSIAAGLNYALHELWTFRSGVRQVSSKRALRYGIALSATLAARIATVAALAAVVGDGMVMAVLVAGAVVSFGVNFLISKFFVFRRDPDMEDPQS